MSEELNYAILDSVTRRVKLGWTTGDPRARLLSCQTGNPNKLQLLGAWPGTHDDEIMTHRLFDASRCEGEWFRLTKSVVRFLRAHIHMDLDADEDARATVMQLQLPAKPLTFVKDVADVHICELRRDREEVECNRVVADVYRLPAQGYWAYYARSIADRHGVIGGQVDRVSRYKRSGEPVLTTYASYPVWVWLAGWLLYAQAKLSFTYDEAWTLLCGRLTAQPDDFEMEADAGACCDSAAMNAGLRSRVIELENQAAAWGARIEDLQTEIDSLKEMARAQQDKWAAVSAACKEYVGYDLSNPLLVEAIKIQSAQMRAAKSEAVRLRRFFASVQAAISKATIDGDSQDVNVTT